MTNAPTSSSATIVSSERFAVMFSSRPTPTTASPPAVAVAFAGSSAASPGSAIAASTWSTHDGALLEARRTELEQDLGGVAVVGDEGPLQRRRGDLVGLEQVDTGRRDATATPGDVGQPSDGGRQARRPDDRRVVGLGPCDEVDDEGAHLVGEDAVAAGRLGLDEDPERGREARLVLEQSGRS